MVQISSSHLQIPQSILNSAHMEICLIYRCANLNQQFHLYNILSSVSILGVLLFFHNVYHWQWVLMVEHSVYIVDNLSGVIVGNLAGPACPDALGTIH